MTITELLSRWRTRRDEFDRVKALVDGAVICDTILVDLKELVLASDEELLSLREAAKESGYSADHLGRQIRAGMIPNAGRRHSPRIRRSDLPRKAGALLAPMTLRTFPRQQIARAVVNSSTRGENDG